MWSQILDKKVQGMLSPPLLNDFCKAFAYALEGQRTTMMDESDSVGCLSMPINECSIG